MSKRFSILTVTVISIALSGPSWADDGWSFSKLNPFKKKPTANSRARASFSDEAPKRSGLPRMTMPTWGARSHTPQRREGPSTMAKLNQGTKDLFGKTKRILMPWTNSSKKKSSSASRGRSSNKTSILTSWLPHKEEKKKPKTVRDFLAQPRPGY